MTYTGQVFIGHLTMDDIYYEKNKKSYENVMGGACAYAAFGSALWNSQVSMVSRAGTNYNMTALNKYVKGQNIDTSLVTKMQNAGINLNILYFENGSRAFVPKKQSANYYEAAPSAANLSEKIIKQNRVFHITPIPIEKQLLLVEKIVKYKKIVTLDPDIIDITYEKLPIWNKILRNVDYFLISEVEFEKFMLCADIPECKNYFDNISSFMQLFQVKNMVLKFGREGVYAVNAQGDNLHVTAYPVNVIDETGAGDAFAGGFGYGIAHDKCLLNSLIYGSISSSFVLEAVGFSGLVNVNRELRDSRLKKMKMQNYKVLLGEGGNSKNEANGLYSY